MFDNVVPQLKAGCLTLAILDLVFSLLDVCFLSYELGQATQEDVQEEFREFSREGDNITQRELEMLEGQIFAIDIINLLLSLVTIVTSVLLIHGIRQARYKLIMPTLFWTPTSFGIRLVITFIFSSIIGIDHIISIANFIALGLSMGIELLCWLCVFSYWQQVR